MQDFEITNFPLESSSTTRTLLSDSLALRSCMPDPQNWYCGWCRHGYVLLLSALSLLLSFYKSLTVSSPQSLLLDEYCVDCQRRRDASATIEPGDRVNTKPDESAHSEQTSQTRAGHRSRRG